MIDGFGLETHRQSGRRGQQDRDRPKFQPVPRDQDWPPSREPAFGDVRDALRVQAD